MCRALFKRRTIDLGEQSQRMPEAKSFSRLRAKFRGACRPCRLPPSINSILRPVGKAERGMRRRRDAARAARERKMRSLLTVRASFEGERKATGCNSPRYCFPPSCVLLRDNIDIHLCVPPSLVSRFSHNTFECSKRAREIGARRSRFFLDEI